MGLTTLFNIGRSALLVNQQSLSVASHNVANVNTPGYNRQEAQLSTAVPELSGGSWFGRGVNLDTVQRSFDSFVGAQLNSESTNVGYYEERASILRQVEDIFNETGPGLSERLQEFVDAWNDISANPEGRVERSALLQTANSLVSQMSSMSIRLLDIRNTYNRTIPEMVNDVNTLIRDIADMNQKVVMTGGAPDLFDRRDEMIRQLAEYVPVTRFEDDFGRVTVMVANRPVVEPTGYAQLSAVKAGSEGMYDVIFAADGTSLNLTGQSGRLGSVMEVRDGDIPGYLNQLDTLAYTLAVQVNAVHETGFGLDSSTGNLFFGDIGGGAGIFQPPYDAATDVSGAARVLTVQITDPDAIAASSTAAGVPGDNINATTIANLFGQDLINGTTFEDYYNGVVSQVGRDRLDALRGEEASKSIRFQLEERRQEISGVNLDEEATNVIRFQRSYEASARIIQVTDELFEVLVNLAQ